MFLELAELLIKLADHTDRSNVASGKDDDAATYHRGQVDLLVPLVKAYASDQAFEISATAIQVFGGAGYLKDWPGPAEGQRPSAYIVVLGDTQITRNVGCDHGIAAQTIRLNGKEHLEGMILGEKIGELATGRRLDRQGIGGALRRVPLPQRLVVAAVGLDLVIPVPVTVP